jgi:hypothetical protein
LLEAITITCPRSSLLHAATEPPPDRTPLSGLPAKRAIRERG